MPVDEITRGSLRQTGKILPSFLPLYAFLFISWGHSLLRLHIAAYTGAAMLVVIAVLRLTRGVLLWAVAAFFAATLVFGVWAGNVWFLRHVGVFPGTVLFAASAISMIMGHPFVQDFARQEVDPERWETGEFVRVCYALTSFWTVVFLALAVNAIMMYYSGLGRGAHLAIQFGLLVVGLAYNTAYTTHVKRKRSRPVPTVPASAA